MVEKITLVIIGLLIAVLEGNFSSCLLLHLYPLLILLPMTIIIMELLEQRKEQKGLRV